jgi:predicted RNA-binding Zn-ribbon protein involved in translation (DUF1610 family)
MKLKRMSLNSITYQGIRNYECPDCGLDFLRDQTKFIIGYGKERNNSSSKNFGIVFECTECFKISYCHATERYIKGLKNLLEQIKKEVK